MLAGVSCPRMVSVLNDVRAPRIRDGRVNLDVRNRRQVSISRAVKKSLLTHAHQERFPLRHVFFSSPAVQANWKVQLSFGEGHRSH